MFFFLDDLFFETNNILDFVLSVSSKFHSVVTEFRRMPPGTLPTVACTVYISFCAQSVCVCLRNFLSCILSLLYKGLSFYIYKIQPSVEESTMKHLCWFLHLFTAFTQITQGIWLLKVDHISDNVQLVLLVTGLADHILTLIFWNHFLFNNEFDPVSDWCFTFNSLKARFWPFHTSPSWFHMNLKIEIQ